MTYRLVLRVAVVALGISVQAVACASPVKRPAASPSAGIAVASTARVATSGPSSTSTTRGVRSTADWVTYFHDSGRSGVAADGPAAAASVHRSWVSTRLDGDVYAQPLLVGNLVIVATENDTVYALDAGSGAIAWKTHLGTPVPGASLPCGNVDPVGITSTPVVDSAARRIYAVGLTEPVRHQLFVLDLATGSLIASTSVDAPGADPTVHNQRGALALDQGNVIVPFGGRYGDCGNYHGRLVVVPVPRMTWDHRARSPSRRGELVASGHHPARSSPPTERSSSRPGTRPAKAATTTATP